MKKYLLLLAAVAPLCGQTLPYTITASDNVLSVSVPGINSSLVFLNGKQLYGTGAPSATCSATVNLGTVYTRTDAAGAGLSSYACAETGGGTYSWDGPYVSTSATYSNPSWLTGLAANKLTGTIPAANLPAFTAYTVVSFSSTPAFTAAANINIQDFQITLTGNVSSSTLTTTSASPGQEIGFKICQDAAGSRTFVWPSNVVNPGSIPTAASTCGKQVFRFDGTNAVAFGGMVSDGGTPGIQTSSGFLAFPAGTTTLTQTVANGTATLGTSPISSATCATAVTVSASGVATTDDIVADFNADPTSTTGYSPSASGTLAIYKYPTANNVNFKVCNNTAASITPGAVTLNWRVSR
jgi:hypothetical protein